MRNTYANRCEVLSPVMRLTSSRSQRFSTPVPWHLCACTLGGPALPFRPFEGQNLNTVRVNTLLRCRAWPSWPRTEHLSKTDCGDRVLYLYGEPSAIYAVFGARGSITLAPVKLHLLCLETPRQSSASYKVVVLQENGNWRQKAKMEREGGRVNTKYTNPFLFTSITPIKRHTDTKPAVGKHHTSVCDRPWTLILVASQSHIIYNSSQRADEIQRCFTVQSLFQSGGFLWFPFLC